MRKKLTLTIDGEVYDKLQGLDRRVSVSEVVTVVLRSFIENMKKGREMTDEELDEWVNSDPELKDFRERLREHWGPPVYAIDEAIEKVTGRSFMKKSKVGKKKKK
jgi:predicted CopG family antitoxin